MADSLNVVDLVWVSFSISLRPPLYIRTFNMTATLLRAVVIAVYHLTVTCRTILAFSLGLRRLINTRDLV